MKKFHVMNKSAVDAWNAFLFNFKVLNCVFTFFASEKIVVELIFAFMATRENDPLIITK